MKNAIHLDSELVQDNMDTINKILKLLDTIIKGTDGVLSGMMIWRKFYHGLNINIEKEILDAFGISSLEAVIHGVKSVILYKDAATHETFLLFNVRNDNDEDFDADVELEAEAFAKIYAKLNSIQEKTGVKIAATITTDGINIESSKGHLVYRIMIPKFELDEAVDITMVIDNTLNDAIKKMMD